MELRHLRYFVAVAEELHFGRAAERCHIAQPPLSRAIKQLEEELGVTLFDRSNRRVELTCEGGCLLETARKVLSTLECGLSKIRSMAESDARWLNVGFVNSAMQSDFVHVITEFREKFPDVHLTLLENSSPPLVKMIREGHVDVAAVSVCCVRDTDLAQFTFIREDSLLAVHEDHPLAKLDMATPHDIVGEPLIMFLRDKYEAAYERFLELLRATGSEPNVVQEANEFQTRLTLVGHGVGLAFVPERMASVCPPRVRLLPFDFGDPFFCSEVNLVWNENAENPLVREFIRIAARHSHTPFELGES